MRSRHNEQVMTTGTQNKKDVQEFWKELYEAVYEEPLSNKQFEEDLYELRKLFIHRKHLAAYEMPLDDLRGKKVCEIGSGAGAHAALFKLLGASMTAVDITFERSYATAKKLDCVHGLSGHVALQADAENLPLASDSFDIVFSNGVLHHTFDTQKGVKEVHRILKPGGKAVIMLYARHSYMYWINLFLIKGLILGRRFRYQNWLGRVTEWMSDRKQTVYNPKTEVYTPAEIRKLFSSFKEIKIRKSGFSFDQIPLLGKTISKLLSRRTGISIAGNLVYGSPWRHETQLELRLARFIGFNLNILAVK